MTDEMTERDYWAEVSSIAETVAEDCVSEAETKEQAEELAQDRLWETVDGHQWVIYTHYNHDVLRFSPNDDYSLENFGKESVVTDAGMNWAAMAFGALYADVSERLGDCLEIAWDEKEEAAESEGVQS